MSKKNWKRRTDKSRARGGRRKALQPKLASQLVALWATHRLEHGNQAPLHFVTFCHDIQLYTRRPIDWKRAQRAWLAAINRLGKSRELGVPPSEMSVRDAEALIAVEQSATWSASQQLSTIAEADSLSVPDHAYSSSMYFRTSEWTRLTVSTLDQATAAISARMEQIDE